MRGRRGHRLATAVDGSGPVLVLPAWWVSHVERDFANPVFRAFFSALAASYTVVRFDRAGVGLSDRERPVFTLDDEIADLEAVIDGLGLDRISLLGISCGAPPAIALSVRRPGLVEKLVVFGGYLHGGRIGRPEVQAALVALVRASWGLGSKALCDMFLPDASPETARRFSDDQLQSATAETSARLLELTYAADVGEVAPSVTVPTLVLHRSDDRAIGFEHGREVAAAIPGAELVVLAGREHLPWLGDTAPVLAALQAASPKPRPDERELTSDGELHAALRRDGEIWTIRFAGRVVHAKHALGLADLALLVGHPHRRFSAIELSHAGSGAPAFPSNAGPVLDETARAEFRARLVAIDEALAAAPATPTRIADLEAEREALVRELKTATGLGGRRRLLRDDRERARKAVTGRIRDSIARLRDLHRELGEHLESAVETGSSCVYAPAVALHWRT